MGISFFNADFFNYFIKFAVVVSGVYVASLIGRKNKVVNIIISIAYGDCVIVEDADAGIEAGKRAGMKTISVHGANGADISIESLENESLLSILV